MEKEFLKNQRTKKIAIGNIGMDTTSDWRKK